MHGPQNTDRPIANPAGDARPAAASNHFSMSAASAPLPRINWRGPGRSRIAASMRAAPVLLVVASIFQRSGTRSRRYAFADDGGEECRPAALFELALVLAAAHDDDLDEQRHPLAPAPRLQLEQLRHLPLLRRLLPFRPVANEHLGEAVAGEAGVKRLVLPLERKPSSALDRRSHRDTGHPRRGDGIGAVQSNRAAGRRAATRRRTARARALKASKTSRLASAIRGRGMPAPSHHSSHCQRWSDASM